MGSRKTSNYQLGDAGEFIITDYNATKPFSSFFPGVAGESGIPMWLFYVNRGQCVCSMGVQDKQHPILEFLPANWAYQLVSTQGFRTFVKLPGPEAPDGYEPFQQHPTDRRMERTQRMIITPSGLVLEEVNQTLGLSFTVEYFHVPEDSYAGLVRRLRVRNLRPEPLSLEFLDGLPLIIPYGIDNYGLKNMRRTIEAFVEVDNLEQGVPFFKAKVETDDRPDVLPIRRGNFYLGFVSDAAGTRRIQPVVDPQRIFGQRGDFHHPEGFHRLKADEPGRGCLPGNRLPSAMGLCRPQLASGECFTYTSIIGHVASVEDLNALVPRMEHPGYVDEKARANRSLIDEMTRLNFVCSRVPALDHYARQNFLDNSLRGGFPRTLAGRHRSSTLHLFSRKHGDLERDYNDFHLAATPMAQGNGNYRDINQNRRCDLFFNPHVGDENVRHFYDLIQLDGYNPLLVKDLRFEARDRERVDEVMEEHVAPGQRERAVACLDGPFVPGELLERFKTLQINILTPVGQFLGDLLGCCERVHVAEHGEGFWTDHWTYSLDLLENYLAFFPDHRRDILLDRGVFTYYDNAVRVRPRREKYVNRAGRLRQLDAVVLDPEKVERIARRERNAHMVRVGHGEGEPYRCCLASKLLCLIVNKLASLDPEGVGVEMEAGKPNWYDALNGMPGLLGSSINETLEIKRHVRFLLDNLQDGEPDGAGLALFEELADFLETLSGLLARPITALEFWDLATTAREEYRERTRLGVSGRERALNGRQLREFLDACLRKLEQGIDKAWDPDQGILRSYFTHELDVKQPGGEVVGCRQRPLPLFLEGPVHYLRCRPGREKALALVEHIEHSPLYDRPLGMFKVNESLAGQSLEIGRARVFSPGWFENESIWLHMEYKYLLELLRNGLHSEFYRYFPQVVVPFFDPDVYGRSILENSSFLVSSANPDPELHGTGFVSRLSGATAEFIHMLMLMTVGETPFRQRRDGELEFSLCPALDAGLFTTEPRRTRLRLDGEPDGYVVPSGAFSFMFLGRTLVTYHNPTGASTFGSGGVKPTSYELLDHQGKSEVVRGGVLRGELAQRVRAGDMRRIEVELG